MFVKTHSMPNLTKKLFKYPQVFFCFLVLFTKDLIQKIFMVKALYKN